MNSFLAGHSHFQQIEFFWQIFFLIFFFCIVDLLNFRTNKVIDTNKYHSAKIRYATLVCLSTNCIRAYIIICICIVITSFLTFIPGKKFIKFGQNPAPVPSKLIQLKNCFISTIGGVLLWICLSFTQPCLGFTYVTLMIIEKMLSFTNFCFLSNQFWHNILNVSWYNTYFKTVKYYVNISFTYYSKVAR